jgi:hypothetical protein
MLMYFRGIGFMALLSNDTQRIKKNTESFTTFLTELLTSDFSESDYCRVAGVGAVTNHKAGLV